MTGSLIRGTDSNFFRTESGSYQAEHENHYEE
jgi:hypothetical protein